MNSAIKNEIRTLTNMIKFCISGNEARHFTLRDDTAAARTAAIAPAVVPPTYTTIDGLSFVGMIILKFT